MSSNSWQWQRRHPDPCHPPCVAYPFIVSTPVSACTWCRWCSCRAPWPSIEPKLEECIEEIIEIAQADNGALLEGDLPQRTRYEATEISMAAQDLLATLYSCMGGVAPRSEREVLQAMSILIERRQEYVNAIAASRPCKSKALPTNLAPP